MAEKPAVLIIGGLGYIGRFLALHIHQNNLASEVRIVDKVLPQLAWLAPEFQEACAESLARIFDRPGDKEWDSVFNCGGETRYSQEDEVYKLRSLGLSLAVGSTSSLRASPMCTAPYASQWVATALCMARVYQSLGEEMKWLWTKDLRTNTAHIKDVTRALWSMATWYESSGGRAAWDAKAHGNPVPTFNVVDKGMTTQGTMAKIVGEVFDIGTGFQGQLISTFARLSIDSVVDDVNDELLGPWAELLEKAGIARPGPLTPFLEKELLKDTDLSMDGTRLEQVVGFSYERPKMTREDVVEVIESYKKMKWWP
ncbi:NAD dependent epimerase/dehydratase family protein [Verticillium alfalfae VaMs.102]|uniref:NAD dependent epimerase/dehydratase family protein n=1 Tax=Verticillium alfalfae (strain VaMs.102 / ATCC MYA-4576 / FGSC 10136) TaxID=526221 RepID=C9SIS5_VERA1|nr:NAD dependent epimerase/dehydratase family protein [Verticillium alfalfae VaMs.102]EEY18848.1 NAD dependent epimerase/dehydratase family protein [Verticillium alfalfae VaMs.102]